jgi:hypothetical protein
MKTNPRARRRRVVIAAVAAAALLGALALALVATNRGSSPGAGPESAAEPQQAALAFAKCMRDNGLPNFPDPDASGRFRGFSHEQQSSPRYSAALQACRTLAPGGSHEQQIGSPAFVKQARAFAQCIRDSGVPNFPDPDAQGRFRGASHELQGDPAFQAALRACQSRHTRGP